MNEREKLKQMSDSELEQLADKLEVDYVGQSVEIMDCILERRREKLLSITHKNLPQDKSDLDELAEILGIEYDENVSYGQVAKNIFNKQAEIVMQMSRVELSQLAKRLELIISDKNENIAEIIIAKIDDKSMINSENETEEHIAGEQIMTDEDNDEKIEEAVESEYEIDDDRESDDEKMKMHNEAKTLDNMLKQLEMRAHKIRNEVSAKPLDNYLFTRKVIDGEIKILATSVSELKDIVFSIQNTQSQIYNKLIYQDENLYKVLVDNEGKFQEAFNGYLFTKRFLDSEIKTLATSISMLKEIVFYIQDIQECLYEKLTNNIEKLYKKLADDEGKFQKIFDSCLTQTETSFRYELNELKETSNNSLTQVESTLRNNINELKATVNNNLTQSETSLRIDMDEVKDTWLSKIDEAKNTYDKLLSEAANSLRKQIDTVKDSGDTDLQKAMDKIQKDYKKDDTSLVKEINELKKAIEDHTQILSNYIINLSKETGRYQTLGRLAVDRRLESMTKFSFSK